jgi:uncharacterized membrane protein
MADNDMKEITESIEVDVPVRTAYDQWTQFEEFPRFMDGVKQVRQLDDTTLEWTAEIAGKEKSWQAKIQEQEPDRLITWHSTTGAQNAGRVEFESLGTDRTRVQLTMGVDPEGLIENIGAALGFPERRVRGDLENFKKFIEERGAETGGWRGEVEHGQSTEEDSSRTIGSGTM